MARLREIETQVNDWLQTASIRDYCPNGVQVRGRDGIDRIATGVSACLALFEAAAAWNADLVLTHHGLLWDKESRVVEGAFKGRLKYLLERDITLMAYHLPLDLHPELGNNARLLAALDLEPGLPFGSYHGSHLSRLGAPKQPLAATEMFQRMRTLLGDEILIHPFGPETITQVAVVSGGAADLIKEAKAAGADLFLTGETSEPVYHFAREEGIHFVAGGHYRTERLGVQALGEKIARHFGIHHRFFDVDNPA